MPRCVGKRPRRGRADRPTNPAPAGSAPNTLACRGRVTASAAQTELSMPPEIATTSPRLRSTPTDDFTEPSRDIVRFSLASPSRERSSDSSVTIPRRFRPRPSTRVADLAARRSSAALRQIRYDFGILYGASLLPAMRLDCESHRAVAWPSDTMKALTAWPEQLVIDRRPRRPPSTPGSSCDHFFNIPRIHAVCTDLDHVAPAAVQVQDSRRHRYVPDVARPAANRRASASRLAPHRASNPA